MRYDAIALRDKGLTTLGNKAILDTVSVTDSEWVSPGPDRDQSPKGG